MEGYNGNFIHNTETHMNNNLLKDVGKFLALFDFKHHPVDDIYSNKKLFTPRGCWHIFRRLKRIVPLRIIVFHFLTIDRMFFCAPVPAVG